MSGQHARLSASSAHRWLACPGSVGEGSKASFYSAQGTFAHSIAAECLSQDREPMDYLGRREKVDGFDVECDLEMVEALQVYSHDVRADYRPGDELWLEMPLLEPLQKIDPDLGGTADAVRYRPCSRHLRVSDFKYGSGTYVEADDNEQLKIYAVGAMLYVNEPVEEVEVVIVQPRFEGAKPVRSFKFKAVELLDFIADLQEAAELTRQKDPKRNAGDHCKFCPQAATCPELAKKQQQLVAADFTGLIDYKSLAQSLSAVALVKERIKAIEELAYAEATAGRFGSAHGYKLVDKRPVRRWRSEGDIIEWAQENKIDAFAPREVLSPAQLEKCLAEVAPRGKKKESGKALAQFIESVSSGTVLVPVADNRPEVQRLSNDDFAAPSGAIETKGFAVIDGHAETKQEPPVNLFKGQ